MYNYIKRLDKDITDDFNIKIPIKPSTLKVKNGSKFDSINKWITGDSKNIIPIFIHCIKLPLNETSGKVFNKGLFLK